MAKALQNKTLHLAGLKKLSNDDVRAKLVQLKGVGNWTIDVYLMFVLQRADVFPAGDLAAVNALKRLKELPKETSREEILKLTAQWKPYSTVGSFILWHYYLSGAGNKKLPNEVKRMKPIA